MPRQWEAIRDDTARLRGPIGIAEPHFQFEACYLSFRSVDVLMCDFGSIVRVRIGIVIHPGAWPPWALTSHYEAEGYNFAVTLWIIGREE